MSRTHTQPSQPSHQEILQAMQSTMFAKFANNPDLMAQANIMLASMFGDNPLQLGLGTAAVHTDGPLTDMLVAYENPEENYIADIVMPVLPVSKKSDTYYKMKVNTMFDVASTQISSAEALPNRVAYGLDTPGTYLCIPYGLLDFIPVEEQLNADAPLDSEMVSVDIMGNALKLSREVRASVKIFTTANYGSNTSALSGSDRFDNSSSDPVALINTAIRTPIVRPNTMVIGEEPWDYLKEHPKLVQYVTGRASSDRGASPFAVTEEMVAAKFGLKRVVVGRARYNNTREGATPSYSRIWGKKLAVIRIEDKPNKRKTQNFAYTFRWKIDGINPFAVQRFFNPMNGLAGGTWLKSTHADADEIIGGANVGYCYDTVIS